MEFLSFNFELSPGVVCKCGNVEVAAFSCCRNTRGHGINNRANSEEYLTFNSAILVAEEKNMKSVKRTAFLLFVCIMVASVHYAAPDPAVSETDSGSAYKKILVYDQNGTWAFDSDKYVYSLSHRKNVNLNTSGCHIYTFAHAIQWLTSQPRNSSNGGALLSELIAVLNGESPESYKAQIILRNYVLTNNLADSVSASLSETSLASLFSKGGVVVSNPRGHYALAVGMTYADFDKDGSQEAYVHIVDSSCQCTLWRLNSGNSHSTESFPAYDYQSHALITGYSRQKDEKGKNVYVNGTVGDETKSWWGAFKPKNAQK